MRKDFLAILCCPNCQESVVERENTLVCVFCRRKYAVVDEIPIFFSTDNKDCHNSHFDHERWSAVWRGFNWETERLKYNKRNTPFILKYLNRLAPDSLFLEIGSGPSFLSFHLAKLGLKVICLDFDLEALKMAKKNFQSHGVGGFFVCADMNHLPFRAGSIDISAGMGVIEHSRTIELCVRELFRVAKRGGYTFQTVPALSLLTFTLNQRSGTLPRMPVLREVFYFFHAKILRGKLMRHGYEEEFTRGFLRKLFSASGFRKIEIGFYDYNQTIAAKIFGNSLRGLIKLRPFWDRIFIKAIK